MIEPKKKFQIPLVDENGKPDGRVLTVGERVMDSIRELTSETASIERYTEDMKKKRRPTSRINELSGVTKPLTSGFVVNEQTKRKRNRKR